MEYERLKSAAKKITLPEEARRRIIGNCTTQTSALGKEIAMKTNKNSIVFKRTAAIAAALVLCLALSVTALASSDTLKGFFRDVTDPWGTVVGSAYKQATDEISVTVSVDGKNLTVLSTIADPQAFPYCETERLGIAAYSIVDTEGVTVKEGTTESAELINGQATITIVTDDLAAGEYTLTVSSFVSEKKADQPLHISGGWECEFTK